MADPIVGWRIWEIEESKDERYVLAAATARATWLPRVRAEAHCHTTGGEHTAPDAKCTCGLYAAKTLVGLLELGYAERATRPSTNTIVAIGEVNLWGRIIETERGYRAQYAYPKRLYFDFTNWPVASWFGHRYFGRERSRNTVVLGNIFNLKETHGDR
jgi:hypothetical protein